MTFQNAKWAEELNPSNPAQDRSIFGTSPREIIPDNEKYISRFAGLDLAKRIDHSALVVLRMDYSQKTGENFLYQEAHMIWPHVNYKTVSSDTLKIFKKYPWEILGFDQQGSGDAAVELFDVDGLHMEGIKTTMNMKIDIIKVIKSLLNAKKLVVDSSSEIKQQILEQESIISNAGNELYKHPARSHDDLFWALGYACYVAMPYVLGYPDPLIRQIGPSKERDIDAEIDVMLNNSIESLFSR